MIETYSASDLWDNCAESFPVEGKIKIWQFGLKGGNQLRQEVLPPDHGIWSFNELLDLVC